LKEYISVKIVIKGKVQGVWYRASAQEQAEKLGLRGFVKNLADGSVYAEVEGEQDSVESFVVWANKGPENALVGEVIVKQQEPKIFETFKIER
jgi:acylphosphatase